MHIHILGICGTFMGSLALLAREAGVRVTGCDAGVYPPMSTQLEEQGIELIEGFDINQIDLKPDLYVIGNAISRGNPLLEEILNQGLSYDSGPGFLGKHLLQGKWVLGVSGTHGKTTTTSMLAWILEAAGMEPGFLIGGVPLNFGLSARLGKSDFFVIEADEYDTAFFDKRSKFLHYRPRTLVFNNLEYDHADIFADLGAIQTQFHHLIRTLPAIAQIIYPSGVEAIDQTLDLGCWSETVSISADKTNQVGDYRYTMLEQDGTQFRLEGGTESVDVSWNLLGEHNVQNAVSAMLAARHVGVSLAQSAQALVSFKSVKRRLEEIGRYLVGGHQVSVYDDFAHHPTAIDTTLSGLRNRVGNARIVALIEPRSNTMKRGVHRGQLLNSALKADKVIWANLSDIDWLDELVAGAAVSLEKEAEFLHEQTVMHSLEELIEIATSHIEGETHVVLMSNGGFSGLPAQLVQAFESLEEKSIKEKGRS